MNKAGCWLVVGGTVAFWLAFFLLVKAHPVILLWIAYGALALAGVLALRMVLTPGRR